MTVLRSSSSACRPLEGDHGSRPLTSLYPKVVFNLMARDALYFVARASFMLIAFCQTCPRRNFFVSLLRCN